MATFTPPALSTVPPVLARGAPGYDPVANALMRHFRSRPAGINVYMLSTGVPTETDPDSRTVFWNKTEGTPFVSRTFWGGTGPYELTAAEATALSTAGYTVNA